MQLPFYLSPQSYQTNLMVYGSGTYRVSDFVSIGVPLTLVVGALTIGLVPVVLPFLRAGQAWGRA